MASRMIVTRFTGIVVAVIAALVVDTSVGQARDNAAVGLDQEPTEVRGDWPDNEPAGMTPILAADGSSKSWPNFQQGGKWLDDRRIAVVNDPESKYGYAIEKRYFVGDRSGWHGMAHRGNFGAFRQLYQRIVFRVSRNWQWHNGGSKFFYWGSAGRPRRRSPTQFYISATAAGHVHFVNQSASGEPDSRGTFRSIGPTISHDGYHTIEVLHTANTPGRSDGALRMWIDGVEVEGFNHLGRGARMNVKLENLRWLDYKDTRLTGLEAFMFWGGSRGTKRVNDWIRVSELYLSGKN